MNQTEQIYPPGIPFRTPRPSGVAAGAIFGALAAYIAEPSAKAALIGGALGGAIGNLKTPLNEALRQRFAEKSLDVVSFYRLGRFGAKILFRLNDAYWTLESDAPQSPVMEIEQIDDWLYGDIVQKLDAFLSEHDLRLALDS